MAIKTQQELKDSFASGTILNETAFLDFIETMVELGPKEAVRKAFAGAAQQGDDDALYMTPLTTKEAILALTRLDPNGADNTNMFVLQGLLEDVNTEIDNYINELKEKAINSLNTLDKLAQSLNNDPNFAHTIQNILNNKADSNHHHNGRYYSKAEVDSKLGSYKSSMLLVGNISGYKMEHYVGLIPEAFVDRRSNTESVARLTHNLGNKNYHVLLSPTQNNQYTAYDVQPYRVVDKQDNHCDIELRWRYKSSSGSSTWNNHDSLTAGTDICIIGDPSQNGLNDSASTIMVDNSDHSGGGIGYVFPLDIATNGDVITLDYDESTRKVTIDVHLGQNKYFLPRDNSTLLAHVPADFLPNSSEIIYTTNNDNSPHIVLNTTGNITLTMINVTSFSSDTDVPVNGDFTKTYILP